MSFLTLSFKKDGRSINIQALQTEMLAEVSLKYCQKVGINDISKYTYMINSKPLNPSTYKSLAELGIYNDTVINVVSSQQQQFINICFAIIGRTINIQGELNMKFSDLAKKVCIKGGITPDDQPKFIFNSMQLGLDEPRTLVRLGLKNNSRIEVVLLKDVIGA